MHFQSLDIGSGEFGKSIGGQTSLEDDSKNTKGLFSYEASPEKTDLLGADTRSKPIGSSGKVGKKQASSKNSRGSRN